MANDRGVYLLNKIIGYQREMDILRAELQKMHDITVTYVDDGEIYISDGIENLGIPMCAKRVRNRKTEVGFFVGKTFVFTIRGRKDNA